MSYPPRPPPMGMGMPYGYAPMGMMPMPMNMIPVMGPAMQPMPQHTMMQQMSRPPFKKTVPAEVRPKVEKPPVTTVFVGNISEKAPDNLVRTLLQSCGTVLSWKRVQGASGKLQGFGFCEYEDPESTLRCIRLLNELTIGDKNLLVKVDAKTKSLLDEHNNKKKLKRELSEKKKKEEKEEGEAHSSGDEVDELDAHAQREDRVTKVLIEATMKEFDKDLKKEVSVISTGQCY